MIEYAASAGELNACKITQACSGRSYVSDPENYRRIFSKAGWWGDRERGNWRPSIHMPRWASRITLEIVSVRVERLQDINEEDAKAEGVLPAAYGEPDYTEDDYGPKNHRDGFQLLWDSINGPRGYGWDVNPFVWCVEFRRIK
jgi:hypothetical protein